MVKLSLLHSVDLVVVVMLTRLTGSVPAIGWGTGSKGACGAAFEIVCILPLWSDLCLALSASAVVLEISLMVDEDKDEV